MLNLGTFTQGDSASTTLRLANDDTAPGDNLAGSFAISGTGYQFTGFNTINPAIAPGGTLDNLNVSLDTTTPGDYTGLATFSPLSQNDAPFSGPLPDVTISISGTVNSVPEPVVAPAVFFAALLTRRRKRIV